LGRSDFSKNTFIKVISLQVLIKSVDYNSLSAEQRRLLDAAAGAMETAYNPYSHFFVGAVSHCICS